jgi:probable F420-dependent oxidoreductase
MDIGRVGIWTGYLDSHPAAKAQQVAAELEALGYPTLWYPESRGRETFSNAGLYLSATKRLIAATGIANMYARDAVTMAAGQRTLAEAYPGRFLLGIGVSHKLSVEGVRGHRYERPLTTLRAYLDAMDAAPFAAFPPAQPPIRVLAALGPKMLALSAERASGAHPYFVPVEHTRIARQVLGQGPLLAPEQAVVLERNPERARAIARTHTARYLPSANYANNLRRLGYSEADLAGGGSDRLVDDIVAWGDAEAIIDRVRAHFQAGADHVCVQVLVEPPADGPVPLPMAEWRALAPALLDL